MAAVLITFGVTCLCVAYVPPFPRLRSELYAASGGGVLGRVSRELFAWVGEPSTQQVARWVDSSIVVVSVGMFALLIALSRLGALPRAPRDPETKRRPSGLGPRLLAMRLCAPLLVLLGIALAGGAWLTLARFGSRGDELAAQPQLQLSAHVPHTAHGRWTLRAYDCQPDAQTTGDVLCRLARPAPIKDVRVSMHRAADAMLEFTFADPHGAPLRIFERDCTSAQGDLRFERRQLATRSGMVPRRDLHVSCATQQVEVHMHVIPGYPAEELALLADIPRVRHVGELGAVAVLVLLMGLALGVQGFSARYDNRRADSIAEATAKLTGLVVFGAMALFACMRCSRARTRMAD